MSATADNLVGSLLYASEDAVVKETSSAMVPATSEGSVHLDAIRGAAALLVFLNHTRALYFSGPSGTVSRPTQTPHVSVGRPFKNIGEIKIATEAVVIFFVLSGYLVGGSVLRSLRLARWSWKDYLIKRLTRLYIVLIPAVLLGVVLDHLGYRLFGAGSIYYSPTGLDLVPTHDLAQRLLPSVIAGNLMFLQGLCVPIVGTNVALWSLSNEFWYYMIFPFAAIACFGKFGLSARLLSGISACALLVFTGLHVALLFPLWVMGALVSVVPQTLGEKSAKILSFVSAVALFAVMILVRFLNVYAVAAEYILALLCSLVLYSVIQQRRPAREGAYRAVSSFFSTTSYSLYLFHLPLAVFICGLINSPWCLWPKTPGHILTWGSTDLLIVGVACGLWTLFEANTERVRFWLFAR
jgi:peptidoglycan/LPS O-acetylase OafA/YrhL